MVGFHCLLSVAEGSGVLCAHSSATERDEWLEAIAKAIDDYTKKKTTFISSRSQEEVRRVCVYLYACCERLADGSLGGRTGS